MRVLLVGTGVQPIPPPGYGGVERTIAEFADALRRAGHDCQVLNEVRGGRGIDEYRFALRLRSLLSRTEYDVLHASSPVVGNRLAGLGRPYVYTTHSRHWFERRGLRQRLGFWLERRAVRRSLATVALTPRLASTISATLAPRGPPRLETIPIGVDSDRFQPDWGRRTGRHALGVGVVRPFKRWELAARALRGTGVSLTIVGPVPDPEYARQVQEAGENVRLLGEVDDPTLRQLYATSDLLVHPSQVELLAGVVLQGLAAGLPILGAAPVADLFHDGESGFASPPTADGDEIVRRFSDAARRLAADPNLRRRMGDAARQRAVDVYGWPSVVARHVALYGQLASDFSRR